MSGQILQKKAINEIPKEKRNTKFMRILLKSPIWITGITIDSGRDMNTRSHARSTALRRPQDM